MEPYYERGAFVGCTDSKSVFNNTYTLSPNLVVRPRKSTTDVIDLTTDSDEDEKVENKQEKLKLASVSNYQHEAVKSHQVLPSLFSPSPVSLYSGRVPQLAASPPRINTSSYSRKVEGSKNDLSKYNTVPPKVKVEVVVPLSAESWMRRWSSSTFVQQLTRLPGPPVTIKNWVDDEGPPEDFEFVTSCVFREGTVQPDPGARSGCSCTPTKINSMGLSCEYRDCSCLDDAAHDANGRPVGFPYHAVGKYKDCLRALYLNERYPIYECNELCSCPDTCKTKVVQRGRRIRLEIFKTTGRGWGLRSPERVLKGRFIDTYIGEVITDEEATRRENVAKSDPSAKGKDSYLFSLDKFRGEEGSYGYIPDEELYVIDGQFLGGPSRFINHSCAPNLRQFTVSFSRGNPKVYELALFALEDIEPYTELTFDYLDPENGEAEGSYQMLRRLEEDSKAPRTKCLCGAKKCRGYLW